MHTKTFRALSGPLLVLTVFLATLVFPLINYLQASATPPTTTTASWCSGSAAGDPGCITYNGVNYTYNQSWIWSPNKNPTVGPYTPFMDSLSSVANNEMLYLRSSQQNPGVSNLCYNAIFFNGNTTTVYYIGVDAAAKQPYPYAGGESCGVKSVTSVPLTGAPSGGNTGGNTAPIDAEWEISQGNKDIILDIPDLGGYTAANVPTFGETGVSNNDMTLDLTPGSSSCTQNADIIVNNYTSSVAGDSYPINNFDNVGTCMSGYIVLDNSYSSSVSSATAAGTPCGTASDGNPEVYSASASGKCVEVGAACTDSTGQAGQYDQGGNCNTNLCPAAADTSHLNWILCPVFELATGITGALNGAIQNYLYSPVSVIFSSSNGFQTAFDNFRDIGEALLVIAGLVMVIGQAAGLEILSAYTVRKALPRIIIAAIGMALAWPILQFVVTLFNDFGSGAGNVILNNVTIHGGALATNNTVTGVGAVVIGLAGGVAVWALFGWAIMPIILAMLLALFIGVMVLAIRQLVILVCILIAPLAIAASILPGTQKLWSFWRSTLLTTLMMFPVIMAFLASGAAMAKVAAAMAAAQPSSAAEWNIFALLIFIAPYFMLPFAFKMSGGLMAGVVGAIGSNGLVRNGFKGLSERRKTQGQAYRSRTYGPRILQFRSHVSSGLQTASSRQTSGFRRRALGGLATAFGGHNIEASMGVRQAAANKARDDQVSTSGDSMVRGSTVNKRAAMLAGEVKDTGDGYSGNGEFRIDNEKKTRQFKSLGGAWVDEADVDRAHSRYGNDTFWQQAALTYEMSKATQEDEVQHVAKAFNSVADGWGMSDERRKDAWIGSAFGTQNQHLEYKAMKKGEEYDANGHGRVVQTLRKAPGAQKSFVDEIYERRGSYNLGQMGSNTIEELKQAYSDAGDRNTMSMEKTGKEDQGAVDLQAKIKAISETFVHEMNQGGIIGKPAEEGGEPERGADGTRAPVRQTMVPGAAHVAERVNELAVMTRSINGTVTDPETGLEKKVIGVAPEGPYGPDHAPTPNRKDQ